MMTLSQMIEISTKRLRYDEQIGGTDDILEYDAIVLCLIKNLKTIKKALYINGPETEHKEINELLKEIEVEI